MVWKALIPNIANSKIVNSRVVGDAIVAKANSLYLN
jgi:hypothetical protein